jgi:hypothetical protein
MNITFEEIIKKINLTSTVHKKHKEQILNNFLKKNSNLATQGSLEWHEIRKYNIGGSEMSIITGDNPYQKIDDLIAQKIGFTKFNGNLATRWGNLFEPLTQKIAEILFDIDNIKETGSLQGSVEYQRYSPDGIGIVKMKCSDEYIETEEYCTVLFEYKAPFTSIPDGKIPIHYKPQVKTGLCSIPFIDFAIFINNMYRKCNFDMLGNNKDYDTNFHNKDIKSKIEIEEPLAYGIILFYQTELQKKQFSAKYCKVKDIISYDSESDSESDSEDGSDSSNDKMNILFNNMNNNKISEVALYKYFNDLNTGKNIKVKDFGNSNYFEFNDLMLLYDEKLISVNYLDPNILPKYNENDFIKHQEKKYKFDNPEIILKNYKEIINKNINNASGIPDYNILGFLPWKLFKSDIIYQARELGYVKKYKDRIINTISILREINSVDDITDKINIFKKYFPKSKILKKCGYDTSEYMDFIIKD